MKLKINKNDLGHLFNIDDKVKEIRNKYDNDDNVSIKLNDFIRIKLEDVEDLSNFNSIKVLQEYENYAISEIRKNKLNNLGL